MNALLEKHEIFTVNGFSARVIGFEEPVPGKKAMVTIDLTGLDAFFNRTEMVMEKDPLTNRDVQVRKTIKVPQDKLVVECEYITNREGLAAGVLYNGFYGWLARAMDVSFIDEAGETKVLEGMTRMLNRDMGVFAQELTLGKRAVIDPETGDETLEVIEISEGLRKDLMENSFFFSQGCFVRPDRNGSLEAYPIRFSVATEFAVELMDAADIAGWAFTNQEPIVGGKRILFDYIVPEYLYEVDTLAMFNLHPRVHIGEGDGGSTRTRYLMAAAAGFCAFIQNPGWQKPGLFPVGKMPNPMFSETRNLSCRNCVWCFNAFRGNDDEHALGESNIATVKENGPDPRLGCIKDHIWLDRVFEAQLAANQMMADSNTTTAMVNRAATESACPGYMSRLRYSGSRNNPNLAVYAGFHRPWVPATREVALEEQVSFNADDNSARTDYLIVARMPGVDLIVDITEDTTLDAEGNEIKLADWIKTFGF